MVKYAHVAVAILLIVASVWRIPLVREPRDCFQLFFEWAALSMVAFMLWHCNKWVALFYILSFISTMFLFRHPLSSVTFGAIFYAMIWYIAVVQFVNTDNVQIILDVFCLIALANVLFLIMQACGYDPIYVSRDGSASKPVGLMSNRNEVSCLLAFCAPAFLSRKQWLFFLPLLGVGFFIAESTGGILAVFVGGLAYLALRRKVVWSMCFVIASVVLYTLFTDTPGLERWQVWKIAWAHYPQKWITGFGLGSWKLAFVELRIGSAWWKTAHNEVVQGVFELGIGFAVIVAGYIYSVCKRCAKFNGHNPPQKGVGFVHHTLISVVALVTILVNSLVHFGFHIATTALIGVTWLAVLEIQLKRDY